MNLANGKYAWLLGHVVHRLDPGKAFRAQQGAEFMCLPQTFAGYVYQAASAQGHKATVAVFAQLQHPVVVYAFYRPSDLMRPNLPAYPIVRRLRRDGAYDL